MGQTEGFCLKVRTVRQGEIRHLGQDDYPVGLSRKQRFQYVPAGKNGVR